MKKKEKKMMEQKHVWCKNARFIALLLVFSMMFGLVPQRTLVAAASDTVTESNSIKMADYSMETQIYAVVSNGTKDSNEVLGDKSPVYGIDAYTAYAVRAPKAGEYQMILKFQENSDATGAHLPVLVKGTSGQKSYQIPVNTSARGSKAVTFTVSLEAGVNILYCMEAVPNSQVRFTYESLRLQNELLAVPLDYVLISGDANGDKAVDVRDLVEVKTNSAKITEAVDFNKNGTIDENDLIEMRRLLVGSADKESYWLLTTKLPAVAVVGGPMFDTIQEAVDYLQEEKEMKAEIRLMADVTVEETVTIPGGCNITITDDGNPQKITRASKWSTTTIQSGTSQIKSNRMFYISENASLTLTGTSGSDDDIMLTLDGGGKSRATSQIVAVGGVAASTAVFTLNAGVRLTNNYNTSDGGAVVVNGVMNMKGGIIDKCKAAGTGGAINLHNPNSDKYIGKYGVMNMSGGTITENTTTHIADGAGGVNVSARCALVMTGGTIADNISPDSVGVNSVRLGYHTSVLKMGGEAYIDCICFANNNSCVELTGNLTTEKKITLFYYASLQVGREVIKAGDYTQNNYNKFELSKQMLPCSLVYDNSKHSATLQGEIAGLTEVKVAEGDLVYTYSNADKSCNVQSACSDGEYVYLAIERPVYNENGAYQYGEGKIIKVDPKTWTPVKESGWLPTNHSNDLTYNSETGELLVIHCYDNVNTQDVDERYIVTAVNPETLTKIRDYEVPVKNISSGGIYALDYNAGKNLYVAGISGYRFALLNSDRSLNTVFTGITSYIKQSIYTNGTTIYANSWDDQNHRNYISSYDWSGNYAGGYYISGLTIEGEGIFQHDGQFYMVCIPKGNGGAVVYHLNGMEKLPVSMAVAQIGSTYYGSLAAAVEAAIDNDTIEVLRSTTIDSTIIVDKKITIANVARSSVTLTRADSLADSMFNITSGGSLTITCAGENTITVDGNKVAATSSMIVNEGTFELGANAGLINGKIADGTEGGYGGALRNKGTATLAGVVNNNHAVSGGAVYNEKGTVTVNGGEFRSNSTMEKPTTSLQGRAGAIYTNSAKTIINGGEFVENTATGVIGGGAIGGTGNSTLEIKGGTFRKNTATSTASNAYGGGAIESAGKVTISGGTFKDNTAFKGGAVYVDAAGTLSINGGVFRGNATFELTNTQGGAIYNRGDELTITGGTFGGEGAGEGNTTYYRGGALSIDSSTCKTANISGAEFIGNSVAGKVQTYNGGGAIYVTGTADGSTTVNITNCKFKDNQATNDSGNYGFGGAIYNSYAYKINITDSEFTSNSGRSGGAIYINYQTADTGKSYMTLNNCIFGNNTAYNCPDIYANRGYIYLSGEVSAAIGLNSGYSYSRIYVNEALTGASAIEIRVLTGTKPRVVVDFANAALMESGQKYFTLINATDHADYRLDFSNNKATVVAK